jgi:hypothetical protein
VATKRTAASSGAPEGQRDSSPGQGPPERSAGGPPPWVEATSSQPPFSRVLFFSRLEAWEKTRLVERETFTLGSSPRAALRLP